MDYQKRQNMSEGNDDQPLKRVSMGPVDEVQRLAPDEMGIKSGVKGMEIKQVVDKVVYKLIQCSFPKVTLKAIGTYF